MKDTCFEFAINILPQVNNEKIKLNLKTKFAETAVLIFCEINNTAPLFCLILSRHIQPCEEDNMKCFAKIVNG